MTKHLILESQIRHAAEMSDLDNACRFIQDRLGVTDGGVASVVFSDFDWNAESVSSRMDKLRGYIKTEIAYQS